MQARGCNEARFSAARVTAAGAEVGREVDFFNKKHARAECLWGSL